MIKSEMKIIDSNAQRETDTSYIGGKPRLPANTEIPKCTICGARQTFFFQVAFPSDHEWTGLTMAVFECISCANEDYLIPEMLNCQLRDASIPRNFLPEYQKNFKFEVFETIAGNIVYDYQERVMFRRISWNNGNGPVLGWMGGSPNWILEDESPGKYDSDTKMHFLMQIDYGMEFEIVNGSPPQIEIGLTGDPEPSPYNFYQLFLGNALYFFGTDKKRHQLVYVITQVD